MNGKYLVGGLLAFTAVFACVLWYTQTYAYYDRVSDVERIEVAGKTLSVRDYQGIDADTSPMKIRACFTLDPTEIDAPKADDATPLGAPVWFDCFDNGKLTEDITAGRAVAYVAGDETPEGATTYQILRYLAVYPDGRAYLWRQYNKLD